jgi:FPC/CPF motif-containing protein YcgG
MSLLRRSLRRRCFESVPDPRIGANKQGLAGIGLNFFSELTDKDAKVLSFVAIIRSPNGLEEPAMAEGLPLVCYEEP